MYLEKFKITNYRRFGTEHNEIMFVNGMKTENLDNNGIDIAENTTLLVGKNNAGKTTVITALEKLVNKASDKRVFHAYDYNLTYLQEWLDKYLLYKSSGFTKTKPTQIYMEFEFKINTSNNLNDLSTRYNSFISISGVKKGFVEIIIRNILKDEKIFEEELNIELDKIDKFCVGKIDITPKIKKEYYFRKFLKVLENNLFIKKYYARNGSGDLEERKEFQICELIELKSIKANNISGESALSKAFNKIVSYRFKKISNDKKENAESKLFDVNRDINKVVSEGSTKRINKTIGKMLPENNLKVNLNANLSFIEIFDKLIQYEYFEGGKFIPENQFGLGYTNLMMIIAEIIDYTEKYQSSMNNSQVNLISIEEPETYMHPQMQEIFIRYINDAIKDILGDCSKNMNTQLIISTHSTHIVNSKIKSNLSLDNIDYITSNENGSSKVINLSDEKIQADSSYTRSEQVKRDELRFLISHVKDKVSELFFSDAAIFVEGVTEERLLKYYVDNSNILFQTEKIDLSKNYISIFNILGAHGMVYDNLIRVLDIPCLIVTDLDIKRKKENKDKLTGDETENKEILTDYTKNISDLHGITPLTTNETLKYYFEKYTSKDIKNLADENISIECKNLKVVYQWKINEYFATSLEEAFIATNIEDGELNKVIAKSLTAVSSANFRNFPPNKDNTYLWQYILGKDNKKAAFTGEILYEMIKDENKYDIPKLPEYIIDGLKWICKKLGD